MAKFLQRFYSEHFQIENEPGWSGHSYNLGTEEADAVDCCEFQLNMAYIVSSHLERATELTMEPERWLSG